MLTSPIRIARRFQAATQQTTHASAVPYTKAKTRIEYTESGRISAVELARMLEPSLGFLTGLAFRPSLSVKPNGVEWEALDEEANVVSGKLVLHAAVSEGVVVSWAEVDIDPPLGYRAKSLPR